MTCYGCGKCDDCLGVAQRGADGNTPTTKAPTEAQRLHVNQDAEWFRAVNRRMRELGLDKDRPTAFATGGVIRPSGTWGFMGLVGERTGETLVPAGDCHVDFIPDLVQTDHMIYMGDILYTRESPPCVELPSINGRRRSEPF